MPQTKETAYNQQQKNPKKQPQTITTCETTDFKGVLLNSIVGPIVIIVGAVLILVFFSFFIPVEYMDKDFNKAIIAGIISAVLVLFVEKVTERFS